MRRLTLLLLATVGAVILTADGRAWAQPGPPVGPGAPGYRPTYSPYLNLFRRGTPFYQNYYGLVRPQLEFGNTVNRLQQQVTANQAAISQQEQQFLNAELRPTGHNFGYMTHQGYFLNNTRGGGVGLGSGSRPIAGATGGTAGGVGGTAGGVGGVGRPAVRPPSVAGFGAYTPRR